MGCLVENYIMSKKYDEYKSAFELKGCKLLTTEEEFESTIRIAKEKIFKIQYTCGHTCDKCWYHMFMSRGSNSICRLCNKQSISDIDTLDIEALSIKYLIDIIRSTFDIVICVETCRCDIIIKLKACLENKWLPIQLKSTLKPVYNQYKFELRAIYTDEICICIGLEDKRQWLFEEMPEVKRINIGITSRNKYSDYEIKSEDIIAKLIELWDKKTTYKQEDINLPSTDCVGIEQEYIKIREDHIKCLTFEKPERNQMVYDFKVNGKKVQEKTVASLPKKNIYAFKLMKSNGCVNKIRKYIAYHIDDNELYWLHLRHTHIFYVIPTGVLFEKGYLQNDEKGEERKTSLNINPDKDNWYNAYKFNYKSIDEEKLIKLFI
jgi:hypothetical protein